MDHSLKVSTGTLLVLILITTGIVMHQQCTQWKQSRCNKSKCMYSAMYSDYLTRLICWVHIASLYFLKSHRMLCQRLMSCHLISVISSHLTSPHLFSLHLIYIRFLCLASLPCADSYYIKKGRMGRCLPVRYYAMSTSFYLI